MLNPQCYSSEHAFGVGEVEQEFLLPVEERTFFDHSADEVGAHWRVATMVLVFPSMMTFHV